MNINSDRLWQMITQLGQIGRTDDGGITRLALTGEDLAAREKVISFMKKAGLKVRQDAAGNIIGRLDGKADGPVIMTGSHIDTVISGGAFDGALGVLAGIEALHTMKEKNITPSYPMEVVVFTDEEGTRFNLNFVGSRAMQGKFQKDFLAYKDADGIILSDSMQKAGIEPLSVNDAKLPQGYLKSYIELHIEQGKVLENNNLPAGIVSGIAGPLWLEFTITGEAAHAGATPMNIRRDPMAVAVKIIDEIFASASSYPNCVATVGRISALPGGINIIPSQVSFTLDLRDIDQNIIDEMTGKISAVIRKIHSQNKVTVSTQITQQVAPVKCSDEIISCVKNAFSQLSLTPFELPSGAGHDAMNFSGVCPLGMIFVRSQKGLSHQKEEYSSQEDCALGAELLYLTLMEMDKL